MLARQPALFGDGISRGAEIDGPYCYGLWRTWTAGPRLLWVLFCPSLAGSREDEGTIRRCIDFTSRWGYGGFDAVYLYAFRCAEPWHVLTARDAVGPHNDIAIASAIAAAKTVIAAWGSRIGPAHLQREAMVVNLVAKAGVPLECLGQTFAGHPWPPLNVAASTELKKYRRPT